MEVTIARIPYLDPATAPAPVAKALAALPGPLNVFAMVANAQSAFRPETVRSSVCEVVATGWCG